MHLLRCTNKLLTEVGLGEKDLYEGESSPAGLGDWYANLFRVSRYKCVLFTNESTLYSFVVFRVGKSEIKKLEAQFRSHLRFALEQEDIPEQVVFSILQDYKDIQYAKTNNRSVVGSMNEILAEYKFRVQNAAILNPMTMEELNHEINRTPLKAIGFNYAVEKLHKLIEFRY